METVTRVFEFDAAHRVMNEKVKCFNLHGHRFRVELTFEYHNKSALGYAIDFKEVKRIAGEWIDEHLDHACILNPLDKELIQLCKDNGWRLYVMGFSSINKDINPSAENIASELFYVIKGLFTNDKSGIRLSKVRLYETPNCWVETDTFSYVANNNFLEDLRKWRALKGEFEYDIRER